MTSSQYLPESEILVERDPTITNSDDWPEFRLSDVLVTLPGTEDNDPVSLLVASENYPVTITGRLASPDKRQRSLYRRKDVGKHGASIVIEAVRSFAYGAYEDGSVDLWAAGKAGWFTLQPGRAYRKVYQDMVDAVKVLFFIADAYTKGTRGAPSASDVFEQYAHKAMRPAGRVSTAAEAMYKHREFLLSSMLAGKEGRNWSKNPMFLHLAAKFPDDLNRIRDRIAPAKARGRRQSIDAGSSTSSLKRKRGRPPKDSVDVISVASSSAASEPKKQKAPSQRNGRPTRAGQERINSQVTMASRTRHNPQVVQHSETPEIEESATPGQDSDSDDVLAPSAGKGKSVLRLKPSKATKGPPKPSGKDVTQDDDDPRSSPLPAKRKRDEPANGHQTTRHTKRRPSANNLDEGIDMPSSPSSAESDAVESAPPFAEALATHTPDPIQESTWTCALDGCTHKVYGDPGDPTSQRLIREHYALHAYDDDARVQLVKRLQAPSLPVGHLVEKVKVVARGEGFPGSKVAGTRFPVPLATKY